MSLPNPSILPVTGMILAGGQGVRMGGRDKGLLSLDGHPLVWWVIRALRPQVHTLFINANRNQDAYAVFGYPVVPDDYADHPGPLAGMATALRHANTDWVQCAPCDTPGLPPELVARLSAALDGSNALIALPHDGERMQPTFALLHRSLLPDLDASIRAHRLAVGRWMLDHGPVQVDFSDHAGHFTNINTPEELAGLRAPNGTGER